MMEGWLKDYYRDVDALALDAFMEHHAEDCVVQFANNPPAKGKAEIRQNMEGFWAMIKGMRHEPVNVWFVDDGATAVLEAIVHYTTHEDEEVSMPVTSLLHRTNDKVDSLRAYVDLSPLFAKLTPGNA